MICSPTPGILEYALGIPMFVSFILNGRTSFILVSLAEYKTFVFGYSIVDTDPTLLLELFVITTEAIMTHYWLHLQ